VRRCAAWSATTPWHCATHSRTANSPHPRKRTAEPSKGRRATTPRPHRDNAVTPGRRGQSPPSPSVLCGHPLHPQHQPGTASPSPSLWGGRGNKAPPCRLLCALRPPVSRTLELMYERQPNRRPLQPHPRSRSWTDTGHAMTPRQIQDSPEQLLMDKRRIPLRSASVRTYTFFTTGFPRFLSIRRARGLQAFDLPLHSSHSNPNYD
jgi:hypothetical protein